VFHNPEMSLTESLKLQARKIGFDLVGIAPAVRPGGVAHLDEWLKQGFAGEMKYFAGRRDAYEHPDRVLPRVKSVVMLAMNYRTQDPQEELSAGSGRVSRYAWGDRDYHHVIRERLRRLAGWMREVEPHCRTRGVVDTAPLLERDFARLAGLGWFGKNTMLINKTLGSWLFLAAMLTEAELEPDTPHETAHCGTCTACLDACPTNAFAEPYVLDATRCISYFTIELRDQPIPEEHRAACGEWLFGCDLCNDVCPWNHKAPRTPEAAFQPRADLSPADAAELLTLDEMKFKLRFSGTPLERPGRRGILRNACIVLGNTGNASHLSALKVAADDMDPVIRDAARWAMGRLSTPQQED
jgi:epoxyqueuosine reductase